MQVKHIYNKLKIIKLPQTNLILTIKHLYFFISFFMFEVIFFNANTGDITAWYSVMISGLIIHKKKSYIK